MDIEILCLTLGVNRTALILETSEEALHSILSHFNPKNQKFFLFIKDCLLSYIKKVGNKTAEERLGVSSFVLDVILQNEENLLRKKPKLAEVLEIKPINPMTDTSQVTPAFKRRVLKFYSTNGDIQLTATKFCVAVDLVTCWIREARGCP
jgi:hypothetical protein